MTPKIQSLCVCLLLFSSVSAATENGNSNYLAGFYGDFSMAAMLEEGVYFSNFATAYQDSTGTTGTFLDLPSITVVTDQKIFGGVYSFGIYPGITLSRDNSAGMDRDRLGLADTYVMPISLNWEWGDFSLLWFEGIIVPTGRYNLGELNTGLNIWTFDHVLSVTWRLPMDNEISATLGVMNNSENSATQYKNGSELHFDYNIGHFFSPDFALGMTGSYYRQISADSGRGVSEAVYGEAASIGPVIYWVPRMANRDITFSIKWLHEYLAEGRQTQDYLISRISFAF